jgi:regulator of sirC expression with transglutaminase-like and TPR domain
LALLDAMQRKSFAGVPRASNLRLLRAELLGKLERCTEALPVLAEYVPLSMPAPQRERALLARASCRAKLQDCEGSRADLQTYLRDFPNGPYASRALMELGTLH